MYHAVSPIKGRRRALGLEPGLLAGQLSLLRDRGFELMALSSALDAVTEEPDRRVVALTFDDAYEDFVDVALPVLADVGAAGTVYVPTAFVGQAAGWLGRDASDLPSLMSWDQLRQCVASGFIEIGSHSRHHPQLDTLPLDLVSQEVEGSKATLEDRLQIKVKSFCYPHGYHDRTVRASVAQAGYENACEVGRRVSSATHRLSLSRLAVGPRQAPDDLLQDVLRGGPTLVPAAKRVLQPAWRTLRVQKARLRPVQ